LMGKCFAEFGHAQEWEVILWKMESNVWHLTFVGFVEEALQASRLAAWPAAVERVLLHSRPGHPQLWQDGGKPGVYTGGLGQQPWVSGCMGRGRPVELLTHRVSFPVRD
jgi:hypothetical protein